MRGRTLLIIAALADAAAALLHLAVIVGGADWYRFVGAGGRMAWMVEAGWWRPHLITVGIAAVLLSWGLFALSGAGVVRRLPLLRTALVAISAVYLLRSLALVAPPPLPTGARPGFWVWTSSITLAIGLLHAIGTWRAWPRLR